VGRGTAGGEITIGRAGVTGEVTTGGETCIGKGDVTTAGVAEETGPTLG
jgi:hypothetical protein